MATVSVGIVGAGIYGNYHIHTLTCDPNVSKVVFCDLDERRRRAAEETYQVKGYASVTEMLEAEELDAVTIATSDPHHVQPACDAIKAGVKYLLIEKPLALTIEECEELVRHADEHGVSISVDFHKRWDPAYNCMRDEIRRGDDTILRGYMALDDIINVPREWFSWSAESSPSWFLGVHCYDLMRYITGAEARSVYARGSKRILAGEGIDTWDTITALITMSDGSNWTIDTSWVLPSGFPKSNDGQLVILTDRHYLKNESYRGVKTYDDAKEGLPNYIFMNFGEGRASGFGVEPIQEFVADIVAGREFRVSANDGLQATRIAQAVHTSAMTGKIVEL